MSGLRLVSAGRKSRKGDESSQFDRQEARNRDRAEKDGHAIVHTTRDVVSSQTMPWERKELKSWMTEPAKIAMYDGILVETDRLARCDDKGWHYIEHWCYENDKKIVTTEGVQFPARDDSDRYQWIGLKRRARTYWEDVRDKHAGTRELIKANGGAIGRAPFGYAIEGPKLHKVFVIDPVWGETAKEAFQRISDGQTRASVAEWLTEKTGTLWRIKRVTDMISRRTYLGERDGIKFEALITEKVFNSANAAMAGSTFTHKDKGGRRTDHGYSGLIRCECGDVLYYHQSTRDGKNVGQAKYRCGMGRRGIAGEVKCQYGAPVASEIDALVNAEMSAIHFAEFIWVTTGGDYAKQSELQRIQSEMSSAMAKKDMVKVTELAAQYAEVDARPTEEVKTVPKMTGRSIGDAWSQGTLSEQRAMLERQVQRPVVRLTEQGWTVQVTPGNS